MRTMTLALLLASATSGSAYAQTRGNDGMDAGEPGPRREWTERRNVQERAPNVQERAPQANQPRESENREQRQVQIEPDRSQRGRWNGSATPPPAPPVAQAQPSGGWNGNRNWRSGRGDVMTTNPPPTAPFPSTDGRWQGRGDDGNRNDSRRWDRDRDERHAENRDSGWHREDNGRWERRGGDNHYDRDGRYDRDRRYDRDSHDWNRGWRNDNRYDWQHYRNQFRDRYRGSRYYNPYGYRHSYQRFGIGIYLDSLYFGSNYWLSDPWQYRLPAAPYGCRWVRYYDDVLLVDTRSGYVVDVIYDFFW